MTQPVVLITGALTGIGRATAIAFAKEGARVVISGRHVAAGGILVTELHGLGAEAEFVLADVRFEADVSNLVDKTIACFGRIDVAVNNAGVEGEFGPVTNERADNYETVFSTNVLGTMLLMKYEMRAMLAQGSGSIVNLSSIAGKVGIPNASVYVASKHAIEGLTKCVALEGADAGVRVNAVAPGPVDTAMFSRFTGGSPETKASFLLTVPAKRAATPDEIAQTIMFLASDKVGFLTGQIIPVDGGYTTQ